MGGRKGGGGGGRWKGRVCITDLLSDSCSLTYAASRASEGERACACLHVYCIHPHACAAMLCWLCNPTSVPPPVYPTYDEGSHPPTHDSPSHPPTHPQFIMVGAHQV